MPSGNDQEVFETEIEGHWSRKIEQVVLTNEENCPLNLSIDGGSDNGEFVCVGDRTPPDSSYLMGHLDFGSIILEIQGQKTAGYTQRDVIAWLNHCCRNGNPVTIKTIPEGSITKDLRQYLTSRFPKGSPDHDLQNTIRDNLYLRTVPCTTRPQRDGEVNGVDYCFLTPEEFMILERSEKLLESGIFEGNHYGTPKPPTENPVYVGAYSHQQLQDLVFLPGAHASSEGKRRRNRSNVEAMSGSRTENKPERHVQSVSSDGMNNQSASLDTLPLIGMNDDLGPLPPQWEKAYTETGEPYFIDHRSGTSHWLDPRLARIRKKTIEDCNDDELPYGWEKIDDPQYGTYYIDHVNRKTQYENPVLQAKSSHQHSISSNNSLNANDTIGGSNMSITKQSECSDAMKRENTSQSGLSLYLPCLPCVNDTQDKSCSTPPIPITSETDETSKLDANTAVHGQLPGPRAIFSKNPADLQGEFIKTILVKSNRGFGFTIVGGDGETEEYLQIKNIIPNGPAWTDGRLKTGDVVVYVNDICVIGSSHQDIVRLFQSFVPGETVELEVCRGYPLQFDLNNPDNEVITTVAVSSENILSASGTDANSNFHSANGIQEDGNNSLLELNIYNTGNESIQNNHIKKPPNILEFQPLVPPKPDFLIVHIVKGNNGFGFTIADSAYGQKVKKILDQTRCQNLVEGDILVAINNQHVKDMQHSDVVQVLKNCPQNLEASITIQRGSGVSNNKITKSNSEIDGTLLKMNGNHQSSVDINNLVRPSGSMKFRSKTPNPADLYSSHDMEVIVPNRPKTPIVDTRSRSHSSLQYSKRQQMESNHSLNFSKNAGSRNNSISQRKLYEKASFSDDHFEYDQKFSQNHINSENGLGHSPADISINRFQTHKDDAPVSFNVEIKRAEPLHSNTFSDNYPDMIYDPQKYGNLVSLGLGNAIPHTSEQNELFRAHHSETNNDPSVNAIETYSSGNGRDDYYMSHGDNGSGYLQDYDTYYDYPMQLLKSDTNYSNEVFHVLSSGNWRKQSTSFEHEQPSPSSLNHFSQEQQGMYNNMLQKSLVNRVVKNVDINVTLKRKETGFGFRIVGGTEDGSQVSIGHIVPGGAADLDGRLKTGDEIISIDGQSVFNTSHHHAVQLMGKAASNGHVNLGVRRTNIEEDIAHLQTSDFSSYDVTVTRKENEGFGFVIISSVSRAGSAIGRIMENSPAERCGQLQIGDRILAVNGTDIMHLHHGEIVNLIKDSGYSVTLTIGLRQDDTCSTSSQSNRPLEKHLEDEQYFSVELTRGTRGFGFSIRGGMEFQNMPLFVLRIADVGPAAQDGRLKIGDQIIEINGVNTKDMTHSTAIEIIKQGGSVVRLLVKRGNKLPLPIEHLVSVATTQDHSPLQSVLSTEYQTHHR